MVTTLSIDILNYLFIYLFVLFLLGFFLPCLTSLCTCTVRVLLRMCPRICNLVYVLPIYGMVFPPPPCANYVLLFVCLFACKSNAASVLTLSLSLSPPPASATRQWLGARARAPPRALRCLIMRSTVIAMHMREVHNA